MLPLGIVVTGTSAVMWGIGKLFIDDRVKTIEQAPQKALGSASGYGYIEGVLSSDECIVHNNAKYVRVDDHAYQVTNTRVVSYQFNGDQPPREKRIDYNKRAEFVNTTATMAPTIMIGEVDVKPFLKLLHLKHINSTFQTTEQLSAQNQGAPNVVVVSTNVNQSRDADILLGEHDHKVIGAEHRYYGIKAQKRFTIFGQYDSNNNKMKPSDSHPVIISKKSRLQIVEEERRFANGWKILWGIGVFAGGALGAAGYLMNKA